MPTRLTREEKIDSARVDLNTEHDRCILRTMRKKVSEFLLVSLEVLEEYNIFSRIELTNPLQQRSPWT